MISIKKPREIAIMQEDEHLLDQILYDLREQMYVGGTTDQLDYAA